MEVKVFIEKFAEAIEVEDVECLSADTEFRTLDEWSSLSVMLLIAFYDEEFGKLNVKMVNAKGRTHTERWRLKDSDGEYNEAAINRFSIFAKTVMQDFSGNEVEPEEMVDHYFTAEIKHSVVPRRDDPNRTMTFVNLMNFETADGFLETPVERALTLGKPEAETAPAAETTPAATTPAGGFDINAILGL